MAEATLSSKGQVTLPADIRKALGAKPQDRISFTAMPGGSVLLRAKTKSMLSLRGLIQPRPGATVSIEEMSVWLNMS